MKCEWMNLTFLKFSDSNFPNPGMCLKPTGGIMNFERLAAVSSKEYS